MASGGYPGTYEAGKKINGLQEAAKIQRRQGISRGNIKARRQFLYRRGRVLGVTARAAELSKAVHTAYETASAIGFEGAHYRKDIAHRALKK